VRANVYVDGFNLYYGCLKGTPFRWLDLAKLSGFLLPHYQIHRIRYFTAKVTAWPSDPQQPQRQEAYLRALGTIPNLTIHLGHYLSHTVRMRVANPPPQTMEVIKTEEKGSDVNLATMLLVDAFHQDFDVAAIISGDSDLQLPIEIVRREFNLTVGVFASPRRRSRVLQTTATFYRPIRDGVLRVSQFPPELTDQHGIIRKPASW
jgi:uncharacterized LabA/DUF88 family protein